MVDFAELTFAQITESVASVKPTPGAGPSLALTCALAAALVEMASAVTLRKLPDSAAGAQERRQRATTLRQQAISLADIDAAAYRDVLAVQRERHAPDHAQRVRNALLDAADPLVRIIETAGEVARLAADAAAQARGGVRGEAMTAAMLASAVARAGVPLVELNLAGAPGDPRLERARQVALDAEAQRARALEIPARQL